MEQKRRGGEAQDYEAVGWRPLNGSWEPVPRPSPEAERHDAELGPHHLVAQPCKRDMIEQAVLQRAPRINHVPATPGPFTFVAGCKA